MTQTRCAVASIALLEGEVEHASFKTTPIPSSATCASYRGVVDDTMQTAIALLPDRDRAMLRYQVVLGKTVDEVGALYDELRSRASARLAG